jgi:hypothetical protein
MTREGLRSDPARPGAPHLRQTRIGSATKLTPASDTVSAGFYIRLICTPEMNGCRAGSAVPWLILPRRLSAESSLTCVRNVSV